MALLFQWWAWAVLGVAFLGLEVLVPGFMFLGFGIGASVVAGLIVLGLLGAGLPVLLLVFALISLLAWFVMRKVFGTHKSQVKVWDKDINDDV